MADATVETEPRFTTTQIAWFAGFAVAVAVTVVWAVAAVTNVFDQTATVTGADGKTYTTSTFELATAKFAVVALILLGLLIVIAGAVVALATVTVPKKVTASAPAETEELAAVGIPAVMAGAGEVFKGLAEAVRGLSASSILVIVGAGMMVFGGAVAWQTIPGTDRTATFETSPTSTSTSTSTSTTSTTVARTTSSRR
jgi:hypothetical protein